MSFFEFSNKMLVVVYSSSTTRLFEWPTSLMIKVGPSAGAFNIRRYYYSSRIQRIDRSAVRDGVASAMYGEAKTASCSPTCRRSSNDAPSVQFLSFTLIWQQIPQSKAWLSRLEARQMHDIPRTRVSSRHRSHHVSTCIIHSLIHILSIICFGQQPIYLHLQERIPTAAK